MTAFVGMASSRTRAFLDVLAMVAALAFLLLIVEPAYEFAADETFITTPALEISNVWRAAALPIGAGLMILTVLLRLLRVGNWRLVLGAVALVGVVVGALVAPGAGAARSGQPQPADLLRRHRRGGGLRRRADRLLLRARHLRLSGADHHHADGRGRRPHGRGHVAPHPAGGAAVRLSRPADRDDRHGAGHGGVPRQPARPRPRRPVLRAGRRRCISSPASPARRRPTWRRSRRCCFPR